MTTFDLRPELDALVRATPQRFVELRVPGSPDAFSLIVRKSAVREHRRDATSAKHGTTVTVAGLDDQGLVISVLRTALEADVDAATWLEITLRELGTPAPVLRSTSGGLPAGDAVVAMPDGAVARVRTIQRGPALWTTRAVVPRARAEALRPIADLAVESLVPRHPGGLAEPLDRVVVRGRGVEVGWPRSWFLTTDEDVEGGLAGTLQRTLGNGTAGMMRLMVGPSDEVAAMNEDAAGWIAACTGRGGRHVEGTSRERRLGDSVVVAALVGPARRAHAATWATNQRALDIVMERARPAELRGPAP
jgi:hypothetical protein